MLPDGASAQIYRVAKQLDSIAKHMGEIQVGVSNLTVRYEYIVTQIEKDQAAVKQALEAIGRDISYLETRVAEIEKFVWKFSGAIIVVVAAVQYFANYYFK